MSKAKTKKNDSQMEKWDIWFQYEELWKPLNTHMTIMHFLTMGNNSVQDQTTPFPAPQIQDADNRTCSWSKH